MNNKFIQNAILTQFARGYLQNSQQKSIANFIAPFVATGAIAGQYKDFADKNSFALYNTVRAVGGGATRVGFTDTDKNFSCKPNALETMIDDIERTPQTDIARLEQAKVASLLSLAIIARDKKVWDMVLSGVPAMSGVGAWSGTGEPIKELDAAIQQIITNTGLLPNRMVIGFAAFAALRNNAAMNTLLAGSNTPIATIGKLQELLIVPNIDIKVGNMVYDTAKRGKADDKVMMIGTEVLIFIGNDSPTQFDPSFAKTFSVDESGVSSVYTYREDNRRSDIYAVDWTEDPRIVAPSAAARITVT